MKNTKAEKRSVVHAVEAPREPTEHIEDRLVRLLAITERVKSTLEFTSAAMRAPDATVDLLDPAPVLDGVLEYLEEAQRTLQSMLDEEMGAVKS